MNSPLSRRNFLALSGAALATSFRNPLSAARPPVTALGKLVAGNTEFALDMYRELAKEKGNIGFSPFSISAALAMTSAGAMGTTLEEMQKTLHFPADPHGTFGDLLGFVNGTGASEKRKHELAVVNAIWATKGYPWRKEFMDITKKSYGAGVKDTDFGDPATARKQINDWVEKETKEKIKDLIPEGMLRPLTRMVLTNAVYFKGGWAEKFEKNATKNAPFMLATGNKADVPLMTQTGQYAYGEFSVTVKSGTEKVQVLELPYLGTKASMLVFLPITHTGADALAQGLTAKHFESGSLKERRVDVFLPRFKVESGFSLKPALEALGMKAAFSDTAADFTGMHTGKEVLYIGAVQHKTFVDVNEEGTEAAGATAVEVSTKSAPPESVEFRADRPFVYAIRDNTTDSVLFLGRYSGPV